MARFYQRFDRRTEVLPRRQFSEWLVPIELGTVGANGHEQLNVSLDAGGLIARAADCGQRDEGMDLITETSVVIRVARQEGDTSVDLRVALGGRHLS
jgi:hypothetical protein